MSGKTLKVLLVICALLFGASYETCLAANNRDSLHFLKIFNNEPISYGGRKSLSPEVSAFIQKCCTSVDAARELLQQSGFKITVEDEEERVAHLNEHWGTESIGYDSFIFAERGAGWWPPSRLTARYLVILFIKEEKIERISASIISTAL